MREEEPDLNSSLTRAHIHARSFLLCFTSLTLLVFSVHVYPFFLLPLSDPISTLSSSTGSQYYRSYVLNCVSVVLSSSSSAGHLAVFLLHSFDLSDQSFTTVLLLLLLLLLLFDFNFLVLRNLGFQNHFSIFHVLCVLWS